MKLLDRFEQSMERMLEGSVGSIFRQKMQPAEIGKALEKAMLDHRQTSVGTTIVPNRFSVSLNPADYAQFAGYAQALCRDMQNYLFTCASDHNVAVLDRIVVTLHEDATVKRGRIIITCAISDIQHGRTPTPSPRRPTGTSPRGWDTPPPSDSTQPFRPGSSGSTRTVRYILHAVDGVRRGDDLRLDRPSQTIGRASDNGIVIAARDVSRFHARIDLIDGRPRVEDIDSTNGTWVNGEAIRHADLEPGDRIAFGSQLFEVVTDADGMRR